MPALLFHQVNIVSMETFRRYPIGVQDFEQLRNLNCVYVDSSKSWSEL